MADADLARQANEILNQGGQDPERPYLRPNQYTRRRKREVLMETPELEALARLDGCRTTPKYVYDKDWECGI